MKTESLAWYNEPDKFKAEWLRQLILAGLIAPGDVDERSIVDVRPGDLSGYTQCHFFAGIGIWSLALRNAGWPDWRRCWTGSCPCPSFSAAGKGQGFDDDRHLWPVWNSLIEKCRPPVLFGEQADKAIGFGWLDLVCGNLEAAGYAVAAAVLGAHSVGASHRRQRLYFCADSDGIRLAGRGIDHSGNTESRRSQEAKRCELRQPTEAYDDAGLASNTAGSRRQAAGQHGSGQPLLPARPEQCGDSGLDSHAEGIGRPGRAHGEDGGRGKLPPGHSGETGILSDPTNGGLAVCGSAPGNAGHAALTGEPCGGEHSFQSRLEGHFGDVREWRGPGWLDPHTARSVAQAGATRGFWADCDWWYGRDGKFRPIGPGLQPLAHGSSGRVGRLRGFGDCIVAPQAEEFIRAYIEAREHCEG